MTPSAGLTDTGVTGSGSGGGNDSTVTFNGGQNGSSGVPATGALATIASGDTFSGSISITEDGSTATLDVDANDNDTTGATLATAITNDLVLRVTANYDSGTGVISLTSANPGAAGDFAVNTSNLTDTPAPASQSVSYNYTASAGTPTALTTTIDTSVPGTTTYTFSSVGAGSDSDVLTGTFGMDLNSDETMMIQLNPGETFSELARELNSSVDNTNAISVDVNGSTGQAELKIVSTIPGFQAGSTLEDTAGTDATATLGSFSSDNDTVTGTLEINGQSISPGGESVGSLMSAINGSNLYGVQATWVPGSGNTGSVELTAVNSGAIGDFSLAGTALTDDFSNSAPVNTGAVSCSVELNIADPLTIYFDGTQNPIDIVEWGGFSLSDTLTGNLELQVGNNAPITFDTGSSGENWTQLAAQINSNAEVEASGYTADANYGIGNSSYLLDATNPKQ